MSRKDLEPSAILVGLFALVLLGGLAASAQKLRVVERPGVTLEIRRIDSPPADGSERPAHRLELTDTEGDEVEFDVDWPEAGSGARLRLAGRLEPGGAAVLTAELVLGPENRVRAERRLRTGDRPTFHLFEVYRQDDRPLTLAVEAIPSTETSYTVKPEVGRPVSLKLEIQRVEGERSVSLETDVLNTFVGQEVSYYFKLGSMPESDSATVRFTPLRVVGEIVELEVQLSGKLPSGEALSVLSRREVLVTTRGSTSTLAFEAGEPPTGYRFLVTPDL